MPFLVGLPEMQVGGMGGVVVLGNLLLPGVAASASVGRLLEAPMAHDGLHTWGPHWHSLGLTASVHPQTQRRTKAELATTLRLISCSRTMMATRSRGWPSRLRPARVANLVPLGQGIGHLPSRTRWDNASARSIWWEVKKTEIKEKT